MFPLNRESHFHQLDLLALHIFTLVKATHGSRLISISQLNATLVRFDRTALQEHTSDQESIRELTKQVDAMRKGLSETQDQLKAWEVADVRLFSSAWMNFDALALP